MASCSNLNTILSHVGTLRAYYVIYETDDSAADNQSPFQKIDVEVVGAASTYDLFENSRLQYASTVQYVSKETAPIKKRKQLKLDNQLMDFFSAHCAI